MLKKIIAIFMLTVLLLSSCIKTGTVISDETDTQETTDSLSSAETDELPLTEEKEDPNVSALMNKLGDINKLKNAKIPDYCTKSDIEGLYDTGLVVPNECILNDINGNILYTVNNEDDLFTVITYDLKTNKELGTIDFPSCQDFICLPDECFLYLTEDFCLTVFDRNCNVIKSIDNIIPSILLKINEISFSIMSNDGRYLAYGFLGSKFVWFFDTETEKTSKINIGCLTEDVYPYSFDGKLEVSNGSIFNYLIDPKTGFIKRLAKTHNDYEYENENGLLFDYESGFIFIEDPESGYCGIVDCNSLASDAEYDCILYLGDGIAVANNLNSIRIYSLVPLNLMYELTLPEEGFYSLSLSESGAIYIFSYLSAERKIFIADPSSFVLESNETNKINIVNRNRIGELTEEIVDSIKKRHNVDILFGSEGNDFCIYDYVGVAEKDERKIYAAISKINDALSIYPSGMLKEVYQDYNLGLRIYLCGSIHGIVSGEGLSVAGGVTSEEDGYITIAVDIIGDYISTVSHELSHAFDRHIFYVLDKEDGTNFDDVWASLSPDGAYAYSYTDYSDLTEYTYQSEEDTDAWFISSYARTYPTEDRAVLFENLINYSEKEDHGIFDTCENIRFKATEYAKIIRRCFKSCANVETLAWEKIL